ncbi:hypothetical protein V2I85_12305 [Pseudomonas viridiflava]|uniref:hypothetical protein n=1 Tax=Pseudomonas viridiflava TaxID=33069 RepID=UPI002EAC4F1A|nr:hypothetical protein [Pseudomonas viridiflava]
MDDDSHEVEALERFVARAERIVSSAFWGWLTRKRWQADMACIIGGDWLAHDGLNIDEFEAFCLNLRLLIQGADGICIRQIAAIADGWTPEHDDLKAVIAEARLELKRNLATRCLVNIKDVGEQTTNAELFDVVFYGRMVHDDKKKRKEFARLAKAGLFSFFLFEAFTGILFHYRNCILHVGWASEQWLKREGHIANDS